MIPFAVNGKTYLVQFRYRTKRGRHAGLYGGALINGVTSCVILGDDRLDKPFVAMGTAICTLEDDWSTRRGRRIAFEHAVHECGLLRDDQVALLDEFSRRFPEPTARPREQRKLDALAKDIRWQAGETKRLLRWAVRGEHAPRSRAEHDELRRAALAVLKQQGRAGHAA